MSAPVNQIECHQNKTSYDDRFNSSSSLPSSSTPYLPHQQQELIFVESVPSLVVCRIHGGYPPPRVRQYIGPIDISGLFDEPTRLVRVTGVPGLRQIVYQTQVSTDKLVLKYWHSQLVFRCEATVPGLPSTSLHVTTRVHCKLNGFAFFYQLSIFRLYRFKSKHHFSVFSCNFYEAGAVISLFSCILSCHFVSTLSIFSCNISLSQPTCRC